MKTSKDNLSPSWSGKRQSETVKPLVIAGPCSAETHKQVMETASALALDHRVDYFRAGIWKPRTTPDSFQGVGIEGLEWLKDVKQQTGLKVTTEVGSEKHVEEALKAGIDMLWIGARTVSNPFIIQEIADALKGVDIPVMVKNPLSPDTDLWEGAIVRLLRSGLTRVDAIHRGFFWWGKSHLRNQPFWHIPMDLKKRMPHIRMIADPSHISGKRELVPMLTKRAMEHHFDGLMAEVHPRPDEAWSDAAQQLTPEAFTEMMNQLFGETEAYDAAALLNELRTEVDSMDEMLVWALSTRMELATKIAQVKKDSGLNVLQNGRWQNVLDKVKKMAANSDMDTRFVEEVYNCIHHHSLHLQDGLVNTNGGCNQKEHTFAKH